MKNTPGRRASIQDHRPHNHRPGGERRPPRDPVPLAALRAQRGALERGPGAGRLGGPVLRAGPRTAQSRQPAAARRTTDRHRGGRRRQRPGAARHQRRPLRRVRRDLAHHRRSRGRHRGPPLLDAFRHRSLGYGAGAGDRSAPRRGGRGRQHHHPAAGEKSLSHAGALDPAQAAGADARDLARDQARQARDHHALPQPGLFRLGRLRGGGRGRALLRQAGQGSDPARGGGAGRPVEGTDEAGTDQRHRSCP